MNIITAPRYQDFSGHIHKTKEDCVNAEKNFKENIIQTFKELAKGCRNQKNCKDCPFQHEIKCFFGETTGELPIHWDI